VNAIVADLFHTLYSAIPRLIKHLKWSPLDLSPGYCEASFQVQIRPVPEYAGIQQYCFQEYCISTNKIGQNITSLGSADSILVIQRQHIWANIDKLLYCILFCATLNNVKRSNHTMGHKMCYYFRV